MILAPRIAFLRYCKTPDSISEDGGNLMENGTFIGTPRQERRNQRIPAYLPESVFQPSQQTLTPYSDPGLRHCTARGVAIELVNDIYNTQRRKPGVASLQPGGV